MAVVQYSTVHIYTQTIHRTTQLIWEECGPCPVFASYTLALVLQLRKKHGKTCQGRQFDSHCLKKCILIKKEVVIYVFVFVIWQATTSENTAQSEAGMAQWLTDT